MHDGLRDQRVGRRVARRARGDDQEAHGRERGHVRLRVARDVQHRRGAPVQGLDLHPLPVVPRGGHRDRGPQTRRELRGHRGLRPRGAPRGGKRREDGRPRARTGGLQQALRWTVSRVPRLDDGRARSQHGGRARHARGVGRARRRSGPRPLRQAREPRHVSLPARDVRSASLLGHAQGSHPDGRRAAHARHVHADRGRGLRGRQARGHVRRSNRHV
mmetsp:Transcript_25023/g.75258  ORF Transcript_25023/g.75258 Transcript_25023/m.75258 type:complete len:217 (-) Transcript_25023:1712-2362(-)